MVSSTRLLVLLNKGANNKLSLASATTGFERTTLLSEWINKLGKPVAWPSLNKRDNAPEHIWSYILLVLRIILPQLGKDANELRLSSPQYKLDSTLTPLINEIPVLPEPLLSILDDYHVIYSSSIQEGMIILLEHIPAQLHLVITSRADLPWLLVPLRSRSQLVVIRAAVLRLTPQETADSLKRKLMLGLSVEDVAILEERGEGWIAGLHMAALSLLGREAMQDLLMGIDHVSELGVAYPECLGSTGWRFGDYLTASKSTQTGRFKAAAISSGKTNLVSYALGHNSPGFLPGHFGYENWEAGNLLLDYSPISHADRVTTPALYIHSAHDQRVLIWQGYEHNSALLRRGVPTEMIIYPRTGHEPAEPILLLDVMARILAWLKLYLLGRFNKEGYSPWNIAD